MSSIRAVRYTPPSRRTNFTLLTRSIVDDDLQRPSAHFLRRTRHATAIAGGPAAAMPASDAIAILPTDL